MDWDGKGWLRWVRGIDWQQRLAGHFMDENGIDRPHLLDSELDDGVLLGATLLLLEAALQEVGDQLTRVGRANLDSLGCGGVAKNLILKRAQDLQRRLPDDEPWKYTHIGRGAFDFRWRLVGAFHRTFVLYSLHAPRWRHAFEAPARMVRRQLSGIAAGTVTLHSVVNEAARADLRLRVRLARYFTWQLGYVADAHWAPTAHEAHAEFQAQHIERYARLYDDAVEHLGIAYCPGWSGTTLACLIEPLAAGMAISAASSGDENCLYDEHGRLRLAEGIWAFIHRAVDVGDQVNLLTG